MQKLSLRKQLAIVRLYLGGLSYDEIATRSGVSKGTVANVVADLKAGQILDAQEPLGQLEILRELGVDLRRCRLTPGQAVAGVAVLSHLQQLGVEPAEVERCVGVFRELSSEGTDPKVFVQAALALQEARESTGLSTEALEEKVRKLGEEVERLQPIAEELKRYQREVKEFKEQREDLSGQISELQTRYAPLSQSVGNLERRETELSKRVAQLEERAQAADERLAAARRDLQALAGLGLSIDALPGFVQRLSSVVQRHGIKTGELQERLLHELEELDTGLWLESRLKIKREELGEVEQAIAKALQEREALESALQQLKQQQATLHKTVADEQVHLRKELKAVGKTATNAMDRLKRNLGKGNAEALLELQKLRDQSIEIGRELGRFETIIVANEWLQSLLALVKGDSDINASQVRVIGLSVLRGVWSWLEQNQKDTQLPYWLRTRVGAVITELVQWKV